MSGVINTGLYPSFLLPNATKAFGDAMKDKPTFYDKMLDVRNSDRAYEEMTLVSGLGMAQQKNEGEAIAYDSMNQLFTQRALHITYGLGYVITEEAIDDLKAEEVSAHRARQLKRAHMRKMETVAANLLNDVAATYADGVALISASHPSKVGLQSNALAVAADLSEASLEQILIDIFNAVDVDGGKIALLPTKLIVPPALEPTAFRLMESSLRPSTADNDANWLRGRIPQLVVNPYLTDADAWRVKTDADDGLVMFMRKALRLEQDKDFDTSNARFKATSRYSVTVGDFRTVFGSPGA